MGKFNRNHYQRPRVFVRETIYPVPRSHCKIKHYDRLFQSARDRLQLAMGWYLYYRTHAYNNDLLTEFDDFMARACMKAGTLNMSDTLLDYRRVPSAAEIHDYSVVAIRHAVNTLHEACRQWYEIRRRVYLEDGFAESRYEPQRLPDVGQRSNLCHARSTRYCREWQPSATPHRYDSLSQSEKDFADYTESFYMNY